QMHLSACYQGSETLSCLTCHDPHDNPPPVERLAHYRSVCLGCHAAESCTVDPDRRARESPDNDCVRCHMPRSDTDIPHFAFAHHRIGIHKQRPAADPGPGPASALRAFLDLSHLGEVDRQRSLGLAYAAVSLREKDAERVREYQKRAVALL